MYAGHAALALYTKARRPWLSLAILVPIAFAPDWVQWPLQAVLPGGSAQMLSHSLVSVAIGSLLVGLAVRVSRPVRASDAWVVAALYGSHWVADVFTGLKETWPGGPLVGFELYGRPLVDVALESAIVLCAFAVYRRSLSPVRRNSPLAWAIPIALIALQIGFLAIQ